MDHRDLHHIINKVASQMHCPQCKGKVRPNAFQLLNIHDDDCVFSITCPKCKTNMVVGAHVNHEQSWDDATSNASTLIEKRAKPNYVTDKQVTATKKALKNFKGNVNSLFQLK